MEKTSKSSDSTIMSYMYSMCCPSEAKEKDFPKFVFSKPSPPERFVGRGKWRERYKRKEEVLSREEKEQKANCRLHVKEYRHPTDKQKYLFVNDQERVGDLRRSYLDNAVIPSSNTGKARFRHGYKPEVKDIIHGLSYCYENGVAESLGQWRVMTPSKDPRNDLLDHDKLNTIATRLDLISSRDFNTYKKCFPIKQNHKTVTGRRDQTIYYPKGMTFGQRSEERDCFYEVLANKEQNDWVKERKELDQKLCQIKLKKLEKMRAIPDTWSNTLRHVTNNTRANPPESEDKPLTKLRQRAQPKISTFWDTDEVVERLHDHPEYEERAKYFSVPSLSNIYYNQVHHPEKLQYCIAAPGKIPFARKHVRCKQCQALRCMCDKEKKEEPKGACEVVCEEPKETQIYPDTLPGGNTEQTGKNVKFSE